VAIKGARPALIDLDRLSDDDLRQLEAEFIKRGHMGAVLKHKHQKDHDRQPEK
jgi:hypothetical protein